MFGAFASQAHHSERAASAIQKLDPDHCPPYQNAVENFGENTLE
jgi:hypothetical protein